VDGNEKAEEWANVAADKPDSRELEWLKHSDWMEVRPMPLPRSLANLKRNISEKKWAEARQWAGVRTCKAKNRMPKSQKPGGVVASSTKALTSIFYQVKTGQFPTGQYLHCTKNRPTT